MHYKIGVYGDEAKTEFILVNAAGETRGRATCIPCNPDVYLDQDVIRSVIGEELEGLKALAQREHAGAVIAHTALVMPGRIEFWRGIVARLHLFSPASAHPRFAPALEQAAGAGPGLLVDCDALYSLVAARDADGQLHQAGGHGCRLCDPGSDYDLGCRALKRALAELQGWSAPSPLGKAVCAALGTDHPTLLSLKLDGPAVSHAQVARLADHVFDLAAQGDAGTTTLIEDAAWQIAATASAVRDRLFGDNATPPLPCGLRGRLPHTAPARRIVQDTLGENLTFHLIDTPPLEGLRRLLQRLG